MKVKSNKFVWILFNVLRIIPASLFSGFFFILYFILSKIKKDKYNENKKKWDSISNIDDLKAFAINDFKYKYDFGFGLMDHDSSIYEWVLAYGDCDDIALYAKKKILKMEGYDACRIGLIWVSQKKLVLHFDCMFKNKEGMLYLFNYGRILSAKTEDELIKSFSEKYKAKNLKYCKCYF